MLHKYLHTQGKIVIYPLTDTNLKKWTKMYEDYSCKSFRR